MDKVKRTIGILMALLMLLGGIAHFISPETYNGLIPDFLPKLTINYLTGIVEIVLGIGGAAIIAVQRASGGSDRSGASRDRRRPGHRLDPERRPGDDLD